MLPPCGESDPMMEETNNLPIQEPEVSLIPLLLDLWEEQPAGTLDFLGGTYAYKGVGSHSEPGKKTPPVPAQPERFCCL